MRKREATETRAWLECARNCHYLTEPQFLEMDDDYDKIIAQLIRMMNEPDDWTIK